jgi:hypothetical protein
MKFLHTQQEQASQYIFFVISYNMVNYMSISFLSHYADRYVLLSTSGFQDIGFNPKK